MLDNRLTGTTALAVTLDATLGAVDEEGARVALMRDGLLYGNLGVQDSTLWCNPGVRLTLEEPGGVELLRGGVLLPLCRDGMTLAQSLGSARAKNMANLDEGATDAYADFLEKESGGSVMFGLAGVSANYKAALAAVKDASTLIAFGMTEQTAEWLVARLADPQAVASTYIWNEIQNSALPEDQRDLAWQASRAPYVVSVPQALVIGMACPRRFYGDRVFAMLDQFARRELGSVSVVEDAGLEVGRFRLKINEAAVNWVFSLDTLRRMTAEDLVAARSVSARALYLSYLAAHFVKGDEFSWLALVPHLETYLRQAALEVFGRFVADGRIGSGPNDGASPVNVTGERVIEVAIPNELELIRLVGAISSEKVQIIGRPVVVPDPSSTASW